MGQLFKDRDRPELSDIEIRNDILREAYATGSLPVGIFSRRQVQLIEDCRREGLLVNGLCGFQLSDKTRRSMERQQLQLEPVVRSQIVGLDEEVMVGTRMTTIRAEYLHQRADKADRFPDLPLLHRPLYQSIKLRPLLRHALEQGWGDRDFPPLTS